MSDTYVRIAQGAVVTYLDDDGIERATTVTQVDEERELIHCHDIPGVLRIEDIVTVGVYGDEANFLLDSDGTDGNRIVRVNDDG